MERRRPRHLPRLTRGDFRGWRGARTWHSLCDDLTLSAEHHSGGHVRLTWVISDGAPTEEWRFETSTWHEAGRTCAPWPRTSARSSRASRTELGLRPPSVPHGGSNEFGAGFRLHPCARGRPVIRGAGEAPRVRL
ncbi:DUF6228 family protein [Streptomyces thermocarboxydus]